MSKKSIIILGTIIVVGLGWHFRFAIKKSLSTLDQIAQSPIVQDIQQNISTPPPLISNFFAQSSYLTDAGVIKYTNQNRLDNQSPPALSENALLDQEAETKLKDMFKQQYFEHISPQGAGPSDLAKTSGYKYISIGENLAMGNFKDDQALVTAWMNSPGHRANILDKKYLEIGVAVGQGTYQGKQTWIAVQEFGQPASTCPTVDQNLKARVDMAQKQVNQLGAQLSALKSQMDSSNPQTTEQYNAYNQLVTQYNNMVKVYNNTVDVLKLAADQYNSQVKAFNACASK